MKHSRNDDIKSTMENRDYYKNTKDWKQYKFWRNKVTFCIRLSKKEFFPRAISQNQDNTSYLWKHIKNLNSQSSKPKIPVEIKFDGLTSTNTEEKAENLNLFLSTIIDKLKAEHPSSTEAPDLTLLNNNQVNSKDVAHGIEQSDFTLIKSKCSMAIDF